MRARMRILTVVALCYTTCGSAQMERSNIRVKKHMISSKVIADLSNILQDKYKPHKKTNDDPFAALNAEVAALPTPSPYASVGQQAASAGTNSPFAKLNAEAAQNANVVASGAKESKGKVIDQLNSIIKSQGSSSKDLFDFNSNTRKVDFEGNPLENGMSGNLKNKLHSILGSAEAHPTPSPTQHSHSQGGRNVPGWFGAPVAQSTKEKLQAVLQQKLEAKEQERQSASMADKKALARKVEQVMASDFAKEHLDPTKISPALRKEMEHVMKKLILKGEVTGNMPTAKDMWQQTEKEMAKKLMQKEGAAVVPAAKQAALPVKNPDLGASEAEHTEDVNWFSQSAASNPLPDAYLKEFQHSQHQQHSVPADWFGKVAHVQEDGVVCTNTLFAGTLPCQLKKCHAYAKAHHIPTKHMTASCKSVTQHARPDVQAVDNILTGFMMDVVMQAGDVTVSKLKEAVEPGMSRRTQMDMLHKILTSGAWPFKGLLEQAISAQKGAKTQSAVDVQVINDWFSQNIHDILAAVPALREILQSSGTYKSWLAKPATSFGPANEQMLGKRAKVSKRLMKRMPSWMSTMRGMSNAKLVHLGYRSEMTDENGGLSHWTRAVAKTLSPGATVSTGKPWTAPTPAGPAPTPAEQGDIFSRFKKLIKEQNAVGAGGSSSATPVPTPMAWGKEGFLGRLKQLEVESKSKSSSMMSSSDSTHDFVNKFDQLSGANRPSLGHGVHSGKDVNDWHKKIASYLKPSPTKAPTVPPTKHAAHTTPPTMRPTLEHISFPHTKYGDHDLSKSVDWLSKFHNLEDEDFASRPTPTPTVLHEKSHKSWDQQIADMTHPAKKTKQHKATDDDDSGDDDNDDTSASAKPQYKGLNAQHANLLKMLQKVDTRNEPYSGDIDLTKDSSEEHDLNRFASLFSSNGN